MLAEVERKEAKEDRGHKLWRETNERRGGRGRMGSGEETTVIKEHHILLKTLEYEEPLGVFYTENISNSAHKDTV